jgi:dipeptidyl aminopeptidase/acylaminoacyl peptidase
MPFEGTELWVGDLGGDGSVSNARLVAGGADESVIQPQWRDDGVLHFVSDRTGWWNLYRDGGGEARNLCPVDAELGFPPWGFGLSSYAFLGDGTIACIVGRLGIASLELLDPEAGALRSLDLPYTAYVLPSLQAEGTLLAFVASSPTERPAIVTYDVETAERTVVRRPGDADVDLDYVSVPDALVFPGTDGEPSYAFYYPPTNPDYEAPEDELPPLRLIVHGGPTAQSFASLDLSIQFWTSRGLAVLDLNYGGSTGFGRAYRERLRGRWGIVDVEDSVAAARFLAESGRVDPERLSIAGGSAGGYTTLLTLARTDVFAAGVSSFGVADLVSFHGETHKFEARYDEFLVGPFEESLELYRERSPVTHADSITRPLLLLQGLDDKVVPPSQAEVMIEALERNAIPYAYIAFEGEGHGFRKAENITRAVEATLYFLSRIFGFEPADEVEQIEIKNLETAPS